MNENFAITAHAQHGMTYKQIAFMVRRERTTVTKYLFPLTKKIESGKSRKTSDYYKEGQKKHHSLDTVIIKSSKTTKRVLQFDVSTRTVLQILEESPHTAYIKRKCSTCLTTEHKNILKTWARGKLYRDSSMWKAVVFTDKSKFNLDGPNVLQYYWHNLRQENGIYSKQIQDGQLVMVWKAVPQKGVGILVRM